ncbi:hypothetical protein AMTRI_Chr12g273800 [Amborella trichopoda]
MPPTVVKPPSADPTVIAAIKMAPATTISLLQFKTSLMSLMYSAVSLSPLHPLSVVSSSVLEGVAAAFLLSHHVVGFISEGNFSSKGRGWALLMANTQAMISSGN